MREIERIKDVHKVESTVAVDCKGCGRRIELHFNGGELDSKRCCGYDYSTEYNRINLVISEEDRKDFFIPHSEAVKGSRISFTEPTGEYGEFIREVADLLGLAYLRSLNSDELTRLKELRDRTTMISTPEEGKFLVPKLTVTMITQIIEAHEQ
jgi:hypothetical protein